MAIVLGGGLLVWVMLQGMPSIYISNNNVAVVEIFGPIMDPDDWLKQLDSYGEASGVPAIVLHVNSPGGFVTPSQQLLQKVIELQDKGKVVVACFDDVAASGAYYAAASADHIVCSNGSMTGSIGVYMKFLEASGLFEKIGLSYQTVKAGEYKDWGGLDRPLAEHERKMLKSVIDDTYSQFVEAVAEGRKRGLSKILLSDPETIQEQVGEKDGEIKYPFTEKVLELISKQHAKTVAAARIKAASMEADAARAITAAEAAKALSATETVELATAFASLLSTTEAVPLSASESVTRGSGGIAVETPTEAIHRKKSPPRRPLADKELIEQLARELAEGKIYTGRQALEVGLVDSLGYLDDAITLAGKLAGIQGKPNVVKKERDTESLLDMLTEGLSRATRKGRVESPIQYRSPLIP